MRTSCLLLAAMTVAGCSRADKAAVTPPTPRPTAASVPIPNAVLFEGMLLGGTPSSENLVQASKAGYKTVISLRDRTGVDEERKLVEGLGMTFVHLPVPVPEGLNGASARALVEVLEAHEGAFLVHCKEGEVAAALMALRSACVDGKSVDEAIAVGRRAGLKKLEPRLSEAIPGGCSPRAPDRPTADQ